MKKHFVVLTTLLSLALVGCGGSKDANATVEPSVSMETSTEPTEPDTVTSGEITGHEAAVKDEDIDISEANDKENIVDEGLPEEETPVEEEKPPVEEKPAEAITLTKDDIGALKSYGATDAQIQAVKTVKDLENLYTQLFNARHNAWMSGDDGGSTGGSGGSGESAFDDDYDPSRDFNLDPDDGSLYGDM